MLFLTAFRYTISLPEGSEYYRISPSLTHFTIKPIGTCFNELFRQFAVLSPLCHSITIITSTGILTRWPSTSPFGCALVPTNPQLISIAAETLVLRCAGFSPALSLLMPTFSFLNSPAYLTVHLLPPLECSPTTYSKLQIHSFGSMLMPDYYPCSIARLVSCYALFK